MRHLPSTARRRIALATLASSPLLAFGVIAAAVLAAALAGCSGGDGEEAPRGPHIEMPELPPPADALEARLRERAGDLATYMMPDEEVIRGEGAAGQPPEEFTRLLRLGYCYKIVGVGGEGVEDLDIMVYSPEQVLLQRDTTRADHALIGEHRALCPSEPGVYRLQVRVREGRGPFALQFYRSI